MGQKASFFEIVFNLALNYFKIAAKQDEENDEICLEWGLTLISLGEVLELEESSKNYFAEGEQKLIKAGSLGNQHAYYHLACFYSLTGKLEKSLSFLSKAGQLGVLPSAEELMEEEWLEQLRATSAFAAFIAAVEKQEKMIDDLY